MNSSTTHTPGELGSTHHLWSVILAGGEGERTRPFIEHWLGRHLPKQYCTFVGTRSMLEHTWDRAIRLTSPAHMVTVCAQTHQPLVPKELKAYPGTQVLFQPENRGTAPGIFLPLTYIRRQNPHATVVVFPSDHFVFPEDRFIELVRMATLAADRWKDWIMLLAVPPTSLELEYGWVKPGPCLGWIHGSEFRSVTAFVEKPRLEEGLRILGQGGLWNTLVLTARIDTLWNMGWRRFPDLMHRFEWLLEAIGTPDEGQVLEAIYRDMPRYNFSAAVLQKEIARIGVMEVQGILWSDWGRPERIVETLRSIGGQPRFSPEQVALLHENFFVGPSSWRPHKKPQVFTHADSHQIA